MPGKSLIGGTAYTIKGGKVLVGGTAYNISKGRTLVGGTGYNISLKEQTLRALFQSATISQIAGRNASSNGQISVSLTTAGTYYAFVFCNGYMGITKLVSTGSAITKTLLKQTSGSTAYGQVYVNGTTCYASSNGTAALSARGQTIAVLKFDGYTDAQVEALLNAGTYARVAGRNSSSTASISTSVTNLNSKIAIVAFNNFIAISSISSSSTIDVLIGNHTTNSSLLFISSNNFFLSTNGTSSQVAYGASVLSAV